MSGRNRVNPDHYKASGRLTTDELARERHKQQPQGATRPVAGRKPETAAAPTSARSQGRLSRGARPANQTARRRTR
jgi:hypothetical protein